MHKIVETINVVTATGQTTLPSMERMLQARDEYCELGLDFLLIHIQLGGYVRCQMSVYKEGNQTEEFYFENIRDLHKKMNEYY